MKTPRNQPAILSGYWPDGEYFEVDLSVDVSADDGDDDSTHAVPLSVMDEVTLSFPDLSVGTNRILAYAAEVLEEFASYSPLSSYESWAAERKPLMAALVPRLAAATADSREIDLALVDWLHAFVLADAVNVEAARKRKAAPTRILVSRDTPGCQDRSRFRQCVRPLSRWKKGLERAAYARAAVSAARAAAHAAPDAEERQYQVMVAFDVALTSLDSYCPKQRAFVDLLNGLLDEHARVSATF